MARNILKAGFELTVYNRTAAKMRPLIDEGAAGAGSPREASAGADVVVTSCPACIIQLSHGIRKRSLPIRVRHITEMVGSRT